MLLNFFTFLIPSWKFFDDTYEMPFIFYREIDAKDWNCLTLPEEINFLNLFFNPKRNLNLFYYAHIQRLLNYIHENQDLPNFNLEASNSYQFFKEQIKLTTNKSFEFQLSYLNHQGQKDTIFNSGMITWDKK